MKHERERERVTSSYRRAGSGRCFILHSSFFIVAVLIAGSLLLGSADLSAVVLELRAQRTLCALLAGAALATAGVLVQGLFRNPLASPDVLGVGAGATLGGHLALVTASVLPAWLAGELLLPIGCLGGAALALLLLSRLGARSGPGESGLVSLLLAGVVLAALIGSASALVEALAAGRWELLRALRAFGFGGVDGKQWRDLALATPLIVAGLAAAWLWARPLDLLLSGPDEAAALGLDVRRAQRWLLVWISVLVAGAVLAAGPIAFVGLVVPHLLRPFTGWEHRRLIPAAMLGGAAFTVGCDVLARGVPITLTALGWPRPGDLPLGVVSGLIGAPIFLIALARLRRGTA